MPYRVDENIHRCKTPYLEVHYPRNLPRIWSKISYLTFEVRGLSPFSPLQFHDARGDVDAQQLLDSASFEEVSLHLLSIQDVK